MMNDNFSMPSRRSFFFNAKMAHLFSYLMIGILPVLVCVSMLSMNSLSDQKQQMDSRVVYGLQQFNESYSSHMEIMDACSGHMEDRIGEGILPTEIPAQLLSYEKNYPQFASVFYFEKTSNRIFSSSGEINYRDFENLMLSNYGINAAKSALYTKLCKTNIDETIVSGEVTPYTDGQDQYLIYLKVLPKLHAAPKSVIMFMLPLQTVLGRLDEYVPQGFTTYSYSDSYLSYIVHMGESAGAPLQGQMNQLKLNMLTHANIDGEDYLMLRVKSNVDGSVHMLAYQQDTLYAPIYHEMRNGFIPVLCALILTASIAFLLHQRYYKSIEQILELPFPGRNAVGLRDPYAYILANTRNVLDQNQQMVLDIRHHNITLLLRGLFRGNIVDTKCIPSASDAGALNSILHAHPRFTAAYVKILSQLPEVYRTGYIADEHENCTLWMISICGGAAVAVLLNHEPTSPEALTEHLSRFLYDHGIVYEAAGLGLSSESPEDVRFSLIQAQVAASGKAGIQCYSAEENNFKIEELLPIAEQRNVCRHVEAGDGESAVAAFDQLIRKLQNFTLENMVSYELHLFILESILSTLQEILPANIVSTWNVDGMIHLYSGRNDNLFKEFLRTLAEEVSTNQETQGEVAAYIAEHILDPDLSIEKVCAAFGLSESAATASIRESTGMTFSKYVTHFKMEYVCTELRTTNRQIKDIVADVGYMDVSNFTRKFRLQYGCTPSAYREREQKKI